MGLGQVWLSFMTSGGSYIVNVLPGLLLTAWGIALALPTASIGATTGVDRRKQGLAGGLAHNRAADGLGGRTRPPGHDRRGPHGADRFARCGIWFLLPRCHRERPDRTSVGRHATQPQRAPLRTRTSASGGGSDQG